MKYRDLRDFIGKPEQQGEPKRVLREVDAYLKITEICDHTFKKLEIHWA